MFRPSMFAIFRLYMRNLSISYTNMCGEFTVCGVGLVRDLFLCWIKGVWTGAVLGIVLIDKFLTYNLKMDNIDGRNM